MSDVGIFSRVRLKFVARTDDDSIATHHCLQPVETRADSSRNLCLLLPAWACRPMDRGLQRPLIDLGAGVYRPIGTAHQARWPEGFQHLAQSTVATMPETFRKSFVGIAISRMFPVRGESPPPGISGFAMRATTNFWLGN